MHWAAGFRSVFMSDVIGPPPVMSIVRRKYERAAHYPSPSLRHLVCLPRELRGWGVDVLHPAKQERFRLPPAGLVSCFGAGTVAGRRLLCGHDACESGFSGEIINIKSK